VAGKLRGLMVCRRHRGERDRKAHRGVFTFLRCDVDEILNEIS